MCLGNVAFSIVGWIWDVIVLICGNRVCEYNNVNISSELVFNEICGANGYLW